MVVLTVFFLYLTNRDEERSKKTAKTFEMGADFVRNETFRILPKIPHEDLVSVGGPAGCRTPTRSAQCRGVHRVSDEHT